MGHYSSSCPNERRQQASDTQALLAGGVEYEDYDEELSFQLANIHQEPPPMSANVHHQGAEVSKNWILLDNQSSVDVFCNSKLLKNVRKTNKVMNIKCNAGVTRTDMIGDLPGYGEVWYYERGIANILSLSRVEEKYRITYDSAEEKQFIVHKENGAKRRFKQAKSCLFYLDVTDASNNTDGTEGVGTVLVNTVAANKTKYTNAVYKQATLARKLQNIIGRSSARSYPEIVESNLLKDCPVVRADVIAAKDIFGPNLGSLKGKTVRHTGDRVRPEFEQVPVEIMERYRDVMICIDIMFVNKIPFLVTISRHIKFGTVEAIKSRKHKVNVQRLYAARGFRVKHGHVDNEFEPLRGDLLDIGVHLNVVSNDEHVPEVERQIRTIKERTRCIYNTVPFK
jgi:hypothetical protein